MEMRRKVPLSIITVVLNDAAGLERTLASIAGQGVLPEECIVIDGASIDGTTAVAIKLLGILEALGVTCIFRSRRDDGIYHAMNEGMALASARWLTFLNAGDCYIDDSVLQKIFEQETDSATTLVAGVETVDHNGNLLGRNIPPGGDITDAAISTIAICHQCWFQRRDAAGPYNTRLRIAADSAWMYECKRAGQKIVSTAIPAVRYLYGGYSRRNYGRYLVEAIQVAWKYKGRGAALKQLLASPYHYMRAVVLGPTQRWVSQRWKAAM